MATEFNTKVTLYQGVPFDNTYKNAYYVSDPTRYSMDSFLNQADSTGAKHYPQRTLDALSFQRKERKIRVPLAWYECDTYNYLRFINPSSFDGSTPNGQIYYAFITHTEYVNDVTTEITFEIDYFATYFSTGQAHINACMVERETVYNDKPGQHIESEPMSPGDAIPVAYADLCKSKSGDQEGYIIDLTKMAIIVLTYTTKITGSVLEGDAKSVNGTLSDGIYSGARIHAFNTTDAGIESLNKFLTDEVNDNTAENCLVYMAPYAAAVKQSGLDEIPDGGVQLPSTQASALSAITLQNEDFNGLGRLDDGYTPKNNKLYTYPYHYFQVDNSNGGKLVIPYEQCGYSSSVDGSGAKYYQYWAQPEFYIWMTLTPPVTVTLKWMNQRAGGWGTQTLALTGYPTCAWSASSFARWWAQSCGKNVAAVINTGVSAFGMMASAGIAAEAGSATAMDSASVDLTTGGIKGVVNAAATVWQAAHSPDYVNGNLSNGNALVSANEQVFHGAVMSIPHQRLKQIDDFFTKFGYQVMEYKKPRLVNRKFFDYIKTQDAFVEGKAPAEAISTIEDIFNRGVTLWHCSPEDVGVGTLVNDPLGDVI